MRKHIAWAGAAVMLIVAFLAVNGGVAPQQLHIGVPRAAALEPDGVSLATVDASAQAQLIAWYAGEDRARAEEAARIEAERTAAAEEAARAAAAAAAVPRPAAVAAPAPPAWPSSFEPCGGAYPPCWRVATESGGNYSAFNPTGCTATINGVTRSGCYGKWQFGWFWGGKLGLPLDLSQATPAQQDEAARLLWNNGAGCSNWSAC